MKDLYSTNILTGEIGFYRAKHVCIYFLCGVPLFFGIWSRWKGLGTWPLATDEFYIAKAVEFIRKTGIPVFSEGDIYSRGLIFQYIEALSTYIFGYNEFALRVPAVLFNLATLPPLFLLGRKKAGDLSAILLIMIFNLSVWEIEFSRFARMYSPFQCAFIWFLYFYYEGFFEGKSRFALLAFVVSFLSIFLYEGAVFIALLLYLPPFISATTLYHKIRHWVISSFILGFNFLVNRSGWIFSTIKRTDNLPAGLQDLHPKGGAIILPDLSLLRSLFLNVGSIWLIVFCLLVLSAVWLSVRILTARHLGWQAKSIFLLILIFSLLQLYGAVVFILLLGYLGQFITMSNFIKERVGRNLLALMLISFFYWLLLGLLTTEWRNLTLMGDESSFRKIVAIPFHYPRVGEKVLFKWIEAMPFIVTMTGVFFFIGILARLNNTGSIRRNFTFIVVIILLFFIGIIRTEYNETRYLFFLYPLIFLIWIEVSADIFSLISRSRSSATSFSMPLILALPFLLFLVSEDFSYFHIRNIDQSWVNFRLNVPEKMASHYYPRLDFRTPAEYLNQNFGNGDIIINSLIPVSFYLRPESYVYSDERHFKFTLISRKGGTREKWTNLPLVHNHSMLQSLFDTAGRTIWLIEGDNSWERTGYLESEYVKNRYDIQLAFTSIDARIKVFRINRKG